MSHGVFTRQKRVTFVNGQLTTTPDPGFIPCGPNTPNCVKVTPAQLAEILYRIQDAKLGGTASTDLGFAEMNFEFSADAMPADRFSGTDADVLVNRSYATTDATPVNQTLERTIWTEAHEEPQIASGTILPTNQTHGLITGLTHYAETFAFPQTTYHPRGYVTGTPTTFYPAAAELAFGSQIGFIDNMASSSILDPGNELWLPVAFVCYTDDNNLLDVYASTMELAPTDVVCGTLTINLSGGGSVSCDLYGRVETTAALTVTPQSWFPYADINGPIWNSGTGALL